MSHIAVHFRAQPRPPGLSVPARPRARGLEPARAGTRTETSALPPPPPACSLRVNARPDALGRLAPHLPSQPLALSSRNAWKEIAKKESCVKDSGEGYCFIKVKNHLVFIFRVNPRLHPSAGLEACTFPWAARFANSKHGDRAS